MKVQERAFQTQQGELVFRVQQLNAVRAGKLLIKLSKIAGPAIAAVAESQGDLGNLGDAVQKLFEKLDEQVFMELSNELLAGVTVQVNGETVTMASNGAVDLIFTGHVMEWLKLLAFSLEVNYGDFSAALGELSKMSLLQMRQNPTTTPGAPGTTTSTGLRRG